ncbi:MAG: YceI family protein [Rhodobacteraceae bacterium]|nr:YceI family protein [Paracoccaceae bacterium]
MTRLSGTRISRRHFTLLSLAALGQPAALHAAPLRYVLQNADNSVGFAFTLSGIRQRGTMPVKSAEIEIDPANLARTRVTVVMDVARARTGLAFATQAMLGPEVLDAARFPTIRFRSTTVTLGRDQRLSNGAQLAGDLTLRDVTLPIRLRAALYRPPGSAPDALEQLSVHLSGVIRRSEFGATGYADLVADAVELDIRAVIGVTG